MVNLNKLKIISLIGVFLAFSVVALGEISKWYPKNKGFYFLDGEKRTEPYGIKKVVNITEKSKSLNKNKK